MGLVLVLLALEEDALAGPSQILLIFAALIALWDPLYQDEENNPKSASFSHPVYFKSALRKIKENIVNVSVAIWILIFVGILIASWSISGIIPGMILIGLDLIHPKFFLLGACISCAIVSLVSGSSWSTVGTIGVAFLGLGEMWEYPSALVAGAILSGAYFGDKMSPLSDTTNLASGISKVPLSAHIQYMIPTTLFSLILSSVLYLLIGFYYEGSGVGESQIQKFLVSHYSSDIWTIVIPLSVFLLVFLGVPAIPSLGFGIVSGILLGMLKMNIGAGEILDSLVFGFKSYTGLEDLDDLLSGGGIKSIAPTVFLILTAMVFGGCMEVSGKIEVINQAMISKIKSPGSLILHTMAFSYFTNLTTSDQYLSVVIPGKTMRETYLKMKLDPRRLSRALEDSGTISSVLIPWNSCGAFMSSTLGIPTLKYSPFCFFHLIHTMTAISLALFLSNKGSYKMYKK